MAEEIDGAYLALKGYCYQFDKTIFEIYNNPDKEINIEQVQDLGFDNYVIQVKHHNTEYAESQQKALIKKPVIQLLKEFIKDHTKQYVLYIYFKGHLPKEDTLTYEDLEKILSSNSVDYDLALKMNFVKKFKLIYSEDFIKLHTNVIVKFRTIIKKEKMNLNFIIQLFQVIY